MEMINITEEVDPRNCKLFVGTFEPIFHVGNFLLGIAFLVPQWFATSQLAIRGLITLGYLLLTIWSAIWVCAAQYFLYNIVILIINAIHLTTLLVKHIPVFIPKYLESTYSKIFRPFHMSKKVS